MELGSRAIVLSEDHGLLYDGGVEDFLKSKELLFKAGFVHKHGRRGEHFHFF
jgi:cobalt/nickel transport system ATP-binding protein